MPSIYITDGETIIGDAHRGRTITSPEILSNMSVAQASHMKTLIVTTPDGTEYVVHGIRQFCREHNLDRRSFMRVVQGKKSQYEGLKARYPETDVDFT